MRITAIRITFLAIVLIAFGAHIAGAQDKDVKAKADKHFMRGIELVEEQAFQEAAIEFQKAYEISPHYSVLYNLGMAHVALGKPVEAVDALSRYLRDGGAAIAQTRRADVQEEIERQTARIAYLTVVVQPEGAAVRVDDKEVGKSPLFKGVRVGVGIHTIIVSRDGYQSAQQSVTVAGEEKKTIEVALKPVESAGKVGQARETKVVEALLIPESEYLRDYRSSAKAHRFWAYATGGAGVALGMTAAIIFAWNDGRFGNWEKEKAGLDQRYRQLPYPDELDKRQSENDSLLRSIHTWDAVNIGFAIAGGALFVTGAVLFFTGDNPNKYDDVMLKASKTSAAIQWNTTW